MRAYDKKKAYRLICKRLVQDGRMPNAAGQWGRSEGPNGAMLQAGHRVGQRKK